ncbi:MAG: LarC family nickel insertion protein, partial [Lentisphaerae bacterium]|nr:LarC family nickel insertion protein [Lentisphaerota bacterium]
VGKGTIRCAHGVLPVPVPATTRLITGSDVIRLDIKTELTTPTGAALLTTLSEGDWGSLKMRVTGCGIGHGGRDLDEMPNIIRSFLVELEAPAQYVEVLETDIDDDTPEMTAALADRLLADGALDVTRTPIYMKKGRLGTRLTVLTEAGDVQRMAALILGSSSTIGVRAGNARRFTLPRRAITVNTEWGPVAAKEITRPTGVEIVPEYEACRTLAESAGVELRRVMQAVRSWRDPR